MRTGARHSGRPAWLPRSPVTELRGIPGAARRGLASLWARPGGRPDLALGITAALAIGGPMVLGQATGEAAAGSVAGLGALNTALVDAPGRAARRLAAAALGAVVNAAALGIGALVADPWWLAALATLVVVPLLVLTGLRSAVARAVAIPATLTFVVGVGLPPGPAGPRFADALAGGAWAVALLGAGMLLGLRPAPPAQPGTPGGVLANHAVRLGLAAALAVGLAAALSLAHGYWLAIAVAVVLRPGLDATAERIAQRVAGTLLGGVAGAVIVVRVHEPWVLIALATLLIGGATALILADYRIASALLTAGVLAMIDIGHAASVQAVDDRLLAAVAGAALALLALVMWPEPPAPPAAAAPG